MHVRIIVVLNGCCAEARDSVQDALHTHLAQCDVQLVQLDTQRPAGAACAFNVGLRAALADPRVQFIASQDADDECAPARFISQLHYLQRTAHNVDACGTYFTEVRHDARNAQPRLLCSSDLARDFLNVRSLETPEHIAQALRNNNMLMADFILLWATVMVPRAIYERVGEHDERVPNHDWRWIERAMQMGVRFANVPDASLYTYHRGLSVTALQHDKEKGGTVMKW